MPTPRKTARDVRRLRAPVQDIRAASATRALQDAAGQASNNALLVLLGAPLVARAAVCGNQVCEAGERAPASTSNLGGEHTHDLRPSTLDLVLVARGARSAGSGERASQHQHPGVRSLNRRGTQSGSAKKAMGRWACSVAFTHSPQRLLGD